MGASAIKTWKDAELNPFKMVQELHRNNLNLGGRVFKNSEVKRGVEKEVGFHVIVNDYFIKCKHLIYATGYEKDMVKIAEPYIKRNTTFSLISEKLDDHWGDKEMIWDSDDPYVYFRFTEQNRIIAGGLDRNGTKLFGQKYNEKKCEEILEKIHSELVKMAGNESLNEEYSKIYILDIDNAFSLNDETFCCTPLLLNEEIAKQYRINFIQVYIHENLHRLYLSKKLIAKLDELYEQDAFYRKNEDLARKHGEGKNEAFIVAAETYISRKLGLKTNSEAYQEFTEYVEGSLVLSPIIYKYLCENFEKQSFDSFLLNLFETKKIRAGNIEEQYNKIMKELKNNT